MSGRRGRPGSRAESTVDLARLPKLLLHAEGLAVFAGATVLYFELDYSVVAYLALALAPDLSFAAFAAGPAVGAAVYNPVHTYAVPLILAVIGILGHADVPVQVALIWSAHIGADRMLGYGLKYPTGFKDTHLERV